MSDLNESYIGRRSYQSLVNTGGAEDAARNDPNMEIIPQETKQGVSQIGYDRDNGVAVSVKDTPTVDVTSPGVYDSLGAEDKAARTGVKNLREENGYWYGEDAEDRTVVLGRVGSDEGQEGGLGETLGEVETFANAPVTGVMRGLVKFGANVLGGTVLDQEKVDEFTGMLDQLNQMAVGDNPAAEIAGTAGEVAGQYVAPAVAGFNTLRALGASPIVASIVAESGVGLLGTSPNDENIFNLIPEDSPTAATIGEIMATDPDDPEWVNRSRNAVEALITLGMGEAAARSVIAGIENAHKISKSPIVEELFKRIDEADARLKADQEAGITRVYGGGPDTDELLAKGKQLADRLRGVEAKVTDTPEFKNWFGDSKVVDENGEPLVVYHGTGADFEAFDPDIDPYNFEGDRGTFHFTDNLGTAEGYSQFSGAFGEIENDTPRVIKAYLSLKNPLEHNARIGNTAIEEWDNENIGEFAKNLGHDGVIIRSGDGRSENLYVAFEPTQIKSIHNSGNFDPNDPRLLAGAGGLALGTGTEEAEAEEVQVASAASKFLRQFMDSRELRFGKTVRTAQDLVDSNYAKYTDGEGIDFNFDNLNTSDEVKAQLNIISENYAGKITDAKKGVIPLEVTEQLATMLGTDPEKAAAAVRSLPTDVEDLHVRALTMRNMLVASGERMDELARGIRDGGPEVSDADYLKFREHLVRHTQLQSQMKGVQTEIGRALSSFRIPAEGARASQITEEMLGALGGRSTAREIADRWLTTPVDRRAKFAEKSWLVKSKDAVFEIWINGLLSGLRTHQVNTLGNAVFSAWQIPERAVGAAIGMVTRSPDRVRAQEVFSMFRGTGEGAVDGIRLAWNSWKAEMPSDGLAKMEHQQLKAITPENFNVDPNSVWGKGIDYIGQGIRLPGRALMAEDEFFKSVGYRMELRAQTTRNLLNARDNGTIVDHIIDISATGPDAADARRLTELREIAETRNLNKDEFSELYDISLNNPTDTVSSGATDYAHIVTFTNELGEFGQSLQRLVRSDPTGASKVVLPFIRTPTNIVKQFGQRGPAAMMMPSVYADFAAGGAKRDMALARIGVGTGVMAWAASLAMEGNITGGGPSDRSLYSAWRENHQPYSIKIGDQWVPYGRIEPIAMLFGSVADAHDFIRYSDDEDANEKVLLAASVGVISNIGSKTFLRGISDVASAYHDPQRYGENYIANLVGTAMPFSSFLRDVNRALDPILRETRVDPNIESPASAMFQRVLNEYKARYPGFGSEELPPKRTFWGEERHAYDGSWPTAFNAFAPKDIKTSPIDAELVRLNTPLSMPTKRIGKVDLNFEQYDRLIQLMNKGGVALASPTIISKYGDTTMRTAMNNLVQSQLWKTIESDDAKIQFLKSVRNDFVDAAREALAREDESLSGAMVDEMIDKKILEGQSGILKRLGPVQSRIKAPTLEVQQ